MASLAASSFLSRYNSRSIIETRLPPLLYRVYCGSFQRQITTIRSFNCHAAYVIVLDEDAQALVWVGSMCSEADRDQALQIAAEIMLKDFGDDVKGDVPTLYESEPADELLEAVIELFGSNINTYSGKLMVAERREDIENATIKVGTLIPSPHNPTEFEQREKAFAHADAEGVVPRVEFIYIEKESLAYIIVGNQYDLWIARGVSDDAQQYAVAFMERLIDREVFEDVPPTPNKSRFLPHLQVVYQGEERYAFRRPLKIFTDFEPIGRTVPRIEPEKDQEQEQNVTVEDTSVKGKIPTVSFAQNTYNDSESGVAQNNVESFEQQRAAAMSAIRRADAGKVAKLPITFSEFRLEEERDMNTPRVGEIANARAQQLQQPLNFWKDIKPQQAQRQILFGQFSPNNPDYASPPKVRLNMGDRSHILPHHFDILEHENLDLSERKDLLMRAKHDPEAILGWQIEIDQAKDMSEHWLRLRRGHVKHGLVFRPLRQVARVTVTSNENLPPSSGVSSSNKVRSTNNYNDDDDRHDNRKFIGRPIRNGNFDGDDKDDFEEGYEDYGEDESDDASGSAPVRQQTGNKQVSFSVHS